MRVGGGGEGKWGKETVLFESSLLLVDVEAATAFTLPFARDSISR